MASNVSSELYCRACGAANSTQATHCFACGEPLSTAPVGSLTLPLTGLLVPGSLLMQRYRIIDMLTTEKANTVYKAEDTLLGNRVVTIKEIGQPDTNAPGDPNIPSAQGASGLPDAPIREALMLAGLIHPNLPRIYDYFVEGRRWYFVADFLEGKTLEAYLRETPDGHLPPEEVLDIGIQLSTVLDYLHSRRLPLGLENLSLNNILRTSDGKLYFLNVETPSLSTPTPSSNGISNLGTTLRQLLQGNASFRARFAPSRLFHRPQPSRVEELITQMVSKDIRQRPASMSVVRQELQHIAAQEPAARQIPKRGGPSRRAVLKGIAGFTVASASGVLLGFWALRPKDPTYHSGLGGTLYTQHLHSGGIDTYVLAVGWSPDGKRITAGCADHIAYVIDARIGNTILTYTGHGKMPVEAIAWSPDSNFIASGSDDSTVQVWNAATGKDTSIYRGHTTPVIAVAWSPDGKHIASGTWLPKGRHIASGTWLPKGKHTASDRQEQKVHVWEAATGHQVLLYGGHSSWVMAVAWSPDGRYIASASLDGTVQVWEATTGRHVFTYGGHTDAVYTVAWSPDGKHIASAGKDKTVQVWPAAQTADEIQWGTLSTSQRHVMTGYSNAVNVVAWSPESTHIASGSDDKTVQVWNGVTGRHIFTYEGHSGHVTGVAWSPNGKYIVSGGYDGTVQVWNAK